jgi:hypothetical protein
MDTMVWESLGIFSISAAMGERSMATPSVESMVPRINTSTDTPAAGLVTVTLSPGRYPTVLAKSPSGKAPGSATTALPSREGMGAAKRRAPATMHIHTAPIRFILFPLLYLTLVTPP